MAKAKEAPETTALIEVRQLPIIAERLREIKARVEATVAEATAMVCTAETVQAVKGRRAELRKQFEDLETQRKAVKQAVLAPYNEFEAVYKDCVADPFRQADAALKARIDDFEGELKARCREDLERYHADLCAVHGIDFLTLDQALRLGGLKINLADAKAMTPRKLLDALSLVVAGVADGVAQISRMDNAPEIMAEYKTTLNVGAAVAAVQDRARKVAEEEKAAEARRIAQERMEAAEAKTHAVVALMPAERATEPEAVYERVTFTLLNVTRTQAVKVRDFLKQEGISYE